MISHFNNVLRSKNKKPIVYDVYYTKNRVKKPLIIFCHGYKGFKDWGAWNLVGKEFAKNNFFFVKFNFSYNGGTLENPIDFPDLNAFGNNNYSHELDDLERVLSYFKKGKHLFKNIDLNNIILIGHSRGGGSVLIKASENSIIKNVISWAGVSDFKTRFKKETSEEFKEWKKTGVMFVENLRTKQLMPHFFQFYEDFKKNEDRFNIQSAVKKLTIPYLVIHGEKDQSILPIEGKNLLSWNSNNKFELIKNGNHTFSAKHPWKSNSLPIELKKVVNSTINFIKSNISF